MSKINTLSYFKKILIAIIKNLYGIPDEIIRSKEPFYANYSTYMLCNVENLIIFITILLQLPNIV